MDVPLKDTESLRPLSSLTLQDALSLYLMFPAASLEKLHAALCAIKGDENYINKKTLVRWRMGESRPRKNTLLPDDMRKIFSDMLSDAFSGREAIMLSFISNALKDTLKFDVSDIEAAAAANSSAALYTVTDMLAFTVYGSDTAPLTPLIKQLHTIASAPHDDATAQIAASLTLGAASSDNGSLLNMGSAVIKFNAPPLPFDVDYYVRHIKNGKDEFLSGKDLMPVNRNIKFEPSGDGPRSMQAVINDIPLDIGFQFKCFAKCAPENVSQLCELLAAYIDYSHARFKTDNNKTYYSKRYDEELELIATSDAERGTVWFLLPDYTVYVTFDPFLNNYFLPEFRDLG